MDSCSKSTVGCAKGTILELRADIARMFGYLDNTSVRVFDKKDSLLPYPKLEINTFTLKPISSRENIMVMLLLLLL